MIRTRFIAYTLFFLLFSTCCFGLELRLREQVLVNADRITLGDVAEVSGPATGLSDVRLLRSPEPGRQQSFSADTVKKALAKRATGLDQMRWTGATSVNVRRDGLMIDQPVIEKILADYLDDKRGFLPQAQISFKAQRFPPAFFLPRGTLTTEVIPSDPQILSSRRFSIIFRVDGKTVENFSINGKLEAIAPVIVAATDLVRGSLLSSQDLNLVELNIVGLRNPCFDVNELVGKKLKRSLRQGTPVDRGTVDFPPMVARGEVVTITLRHGSMELSARGEARQDGKAGETIRVRNLGSKRNILGRVVAPGVIEVEY